MKVTVFYTNGNERSKIIGRALSAGIAKHETGVRLVLSRDYRGPPDSDVAIHYGFADRLKLIFDEHRIAGRKAIYVDLGYWLRRKRTRFDGYHKIVINSRHPTAYFQDRKHPSDRFNALGITIEPWRSEGRHVLVIGMSGKGALAEGFAPEQWERRTIAKLRAITKRPIVYRPKPNWPGAKPIPGAVFQKDVPLADALKDCHAVVSYHSNVAVEAIVAGVPALTTHGIASFMGTRNLEQVDNPYMPDCRAQWAADLAYTQWTIAEMESGAFWAHMKTEGLLL